MNETFDYHTPMPARHDSRRVWQAILSLLRAGLLLVMGASGFHSWVLWKVFEESNVLPGQSLTLFERWLAVFIIALIAYCVTFVTRKRSIPD